MEGFKTTGLEERSANWKCAVSGKKKYVPRIAAVVFGITRIRGLFRDLDLYRAENVWSFSASGPVFASAASAARGARNVDVRDWAMLSMALGGRGLRLDEESWLVEVLGSR